MSDIEPVSDRELAEAAKYRLPVAGRDLRLAYALYRTYGYNGVAQAVWRHRRVVEGRETMRKSLRGSRSRW